MALPGTSRAWARGTGSCGTSRAPDGTLWAAGSSSQSSDPYLVKSTDGGITWTETDTAGATNLYEVDALGNGELWTTAFGSIAHSTDNGAAWTTQNPDKPTAPIAAVAFADSSRGIGVRLNASMLYTTKDGGQTWSYIRYTEGDHTSIHLADVWVGSDGFGFAIAKDDRVKKGTILSFQL